MYRPYRRFVQCGVFAAMFLIPVLNSYEIYAVTGTFYAINIGGLGIADPVVIFQAIFASGELTIPLLTAAIFPVFLALLLGRVWCGWMCPYHLLADTAAWLRTKFVARILPTGKGQRLPVSGTLPANICRFGFLIAGTVAAGAIGIPVLNYVNAPAITSTEAMIFVKEHSVSLELGFIALFYSQCGDRYSNSQSALLQRESLFRCLPHGTGALPGRCRPLVHQLRPVH
jgi:ferredoxin-type protein NapH